MNAFVREYIAIITREKAVPIFLFCIWLLGLIVSLLPNMIKNRDGVRNIESVLLSYEHVCRSAAASTVYRYV